MNWEQLLYLTKPEQWSAAAMYQVFLLVLVLISFSLICDDNSGLEFLMVLKCFKTGLIVPSILKRKG